MEIRLPKIPIVQQAIKLHRDLIESGKIAREINQEMKANGGDDDAEDDGENITGRIEEVSTA